MIPRASADAVRNVILDRVVDSLAAKGLTPSDVPPSFDLLLEGVIDSFGVVEMIMMLEQRFGVEFDLDELPADDVTKVGPLSAYIERKSSES
jgi:acyl carrier protein